MSIRSTKYDTSLNKIFIFIYGQWSYSLLIDNDIADSHFYLIRVYTGLRSGAGTDSNIGFVLVGEKIDTGVRRLNDESGVVIDY